MARITRENVSKAMADLNDTLRRWNMDHRYQVLSENDKLSLVRESPSHIHLDTTIQVGLSTREMYLVLKMMRSVIVDNAISAINN